VQRVDVFPTMPTMAKRMRMRKGTSKKQHTNVPYVGRPSSRPSYLSGQPTETTTMQNYKATQSKKHPSYPRRLANPPNRPSHSLLSRADPDLYTSPFALAALIPTLTGLSTSSQSSSIDIFLGVSSLPPPPTRRMRPFFSAHCSRSTTTPRMTLNRMTSVIAM
jgi:hypothetical protein